MLIELVPAEVAKILPCPFCAGSNLAHWTPTGSGWIKCGDCGAEGPHHTNPTLWLEAWNRRAP